MKKFMKKNKQFFLGFGLGFMLFLGLVVGVSLSIDTSKVNQLQQYTQTVRTNDMFNPIIINNDEGIMEIEITLPTLNLIDNELDMSDVFCRFGRIENPISSVLDWVDRGQYLTDFLMWGEEYDDYCDSPDPTDTYYTHFYYAWDTGLTIMEGFTYVLILDFYDGDGDFYMCEELWDMMSWFGEEEFPPMTIRPPRPIAEGLSINIDPDPDEDAIEDLLLNCDYVSFFEYQAQEELAVTPTGTETDTGDEPGSTADGWMNQYDILPTIKNSIVLLFLLLFFGLLGLFIFLILFFKKKKENEKKKKKGKKK